MLFEEWAHNSMFEGVRHSLMMEVIVPTLLSRCFIKRGVGIGSRQQDFGSDEILMDMTSSSVTHLKSDQHSP